MIISSTRFDKAALIAQRINSSSSFLSNILHRIKSIFFLLFLSEGIRENVRCRHGLTWNRHVDPDRADHYRWKRDVIWMTLSCNCTHSTARTAVQHVLICIVQLVQTFPFIFLISNISTCLSNIHYCTYNHQSRYRMETLQELVCCGVEEEEDVHQGEKQRTGSHIQILIQIHFLIRYWVL